MRWLIRFFSVWLLCACSSSTGDSERNANGGTGGSGGGGGSGATGGSAGAAPGEGEPCGIKHACGEGLICGPSGRCVQTEGCAKRECTGNGACVSARCACHPGWAGNTCTECAAGYRKLDGLCLLADPGTPNYELEIIQPRPGLGVTNRFYKAYPGLEYDVRLAVVGGVYPYHFSLIAGPSGMTIARQTGTLSWPSPAAAASPHRVSVNVTDQTGATAEVTWSLTVTESGFLFVDANAGRAAADGGRGTRAEPFRTLGDIYEGQDYDAKYREAYRDHFVYFRAGTYRVEDAYLEDTTTPDGSGRLPLTDGRKPIVWLAYPGDTPPVVDLTRGYIGVYGGNSNTYFDGLAFTNLANFARKGLHIGPADHITVRRCWFSQLRDGGVGGANNQSAIMIPSNGSPNTPGRYMAFQENMFEDIAGYAIIAYTSHRVLFADSSLQRFSKNTPAIGPKQDNSMWFIRGNRLSDMDNTRAIWLYGAGATDDQEVSYNLVLGAAADAALSVNQAAPTSAGRSHIFRNTFVGPVVIHWADQSSGPFRLYENVIINDSPPSHIQCSGCTSTAGIINEDNLVGSPGDGLVDEQGYLIGESAALCGTRGHMQSCTVPPGN